MTTKNSFQLTINKTLFPWQPIRLVSPDNQQYPFPMTTKKTLFTWQSTRPFSHDNQEDSFHLQINKTFFPWQPIRPFSPVNQYNSFSMTTKKTSYTWQPTLLLSLNSVNVNVATPPPSLYYLHYYRLWPLYITKHNECSVNITCHFVITR